MMRCFNKYYYALKSQYNNISMLKVKLSSKTYQSEYDVKCDQWMITHCGKIRWSESSRRPKTGKRGGTIDEKSKTKLLSMWCNIARLCCKSIRRCFLIDYLSIGQWSTIDNKEWWGSYSTTFMFNTPRATTRKGGLILYSPIGQTTLGSVSDNTG